MTVRGIHRSTGRTWEYGGIKMSTERTRSTGEYIRVPVGEMTVQWDTLYCVRSTEGHGNTGDT